MQTENKILMRQARESLKGKWGLAIGTCIVYGLVLTVIPLLGPLLLSGPMAVGMATFALAISRTQEARLDQIFKGFNNFGTALGAYFLMVIFVMLWSFLLFIPGIVAAISYAMTFFIIADDPETGAMDAIDKSKKMMYGFKWKYFRLCLRYFGLSLLCLLTLGIGFFWLIPYIQITNAKFYEDVKRNAAASDSLAASPLQH